MSRGSFVWYDLQTTDIDAAKNFYTAVVGFGLADFPMPVGAPSYTMFADANGHPIGGVMALPEAAKAMGAPPHWLAYVAVEDVDTAAAWVASNGGTVLAPPFDIPTVGRASVIMDPQGAVISLFARAEDRPTTYPNPIPNGQASWNELMTDDRQAAASWYGSLFGWTERERMDMGEMGIYSMYGFDHAPYAFGGMMNKPPMMPKSAWLHYFKVADLEAALEVVKANGGKIMNGPMDVPGGDRVAQCIDPQGAAFALHCTTG
jgi:uncharacterized protein